MPENTPPPDSGAGTGAGAPAGDPPNPPEPPKPVTFESQEALDRMIADRLRRAVPADYADLQELKKKVDAEEEAKKTEQQKAEDARKEAEKKAREREQRANVKLIRAEVLAEAAAQNALDGDIVAQLLQGSKDIKVDDEGEVIGAKEAVAALLASKPVLVKGKPGASGAEFGGSDPKTAVAKIAELEQKMNNPQLPLSERQNAGREARALKMGLVTS